MPQYHSTKSIPLFLIILFSVMSFSDVAVKAHNTDSIFYSVETHTTFSSGDNTPFWLVNNLQGLGSPDKNNGFVRTSVFKNIDATKKFSWGGGIDLVGGWHMTAPFNVHQLYGELKYRCINVLVGSKELWGDFNNHRISSGNLLYSGNAMPIPQLRAGIFEYADIWGTNRWLGVKGYISYGMFTDSFWQKSWSAPNAKHTKNVLYHSKGLWLRAGNIRKFPLIAEIGIEMATQFGGECYINGKVIKMPHNLKSWFKAFFPAGGGPDTPVDEQTNVEGNMLGAYYMALSWVPQKDWSIKAYFEHYFEDHSQMTFEYGWKDGLLGFEIQFPKNPFVSSLVYEYLASKDQTGAVLNNQTPELPEQVSGRDNYYNHYIYSGWQHWGMGIGNPLAISPIYNKNHHISFLDTRILAHHIGFSGDPTPGWSYRVLLSFSRNWGTYDKPYPDVINNFNGLIEASWNPDILKGWKLTAGIATDHGKLLGNNFGVMLSISKSGFIKF